jgi:hypothetical protein
MTVERTTVAAALAAAAGLGAWLFLRPRAASASSTEAPPVPPKPQAKPKPAAKPAPAPAPAPTPAAQATPTTDQVEPGSASAIDSAGELAKTNRYETAFENVGEPDWVKVSTLPGKLITRVPLRTTGPESAQGITWARATERTAQAIAKRFGARLPTADELRAVAKAPEVTIVQACTFPSDHKTIRMYSSEAARRADECVRKNLGENPAGIPFTIGKFWVNGPCQKEGKKPMYGFFARKGDASSLIQKGGCTFHDDLHVDYSSTVFLVKDLAAA